MDDAYQCKLWDIFPNNMSIAGVGTDDTIILDGCHAASIRWGSFAQVAYTQQWSFKRWTAAVVLHLSGFIFWTLASLYPWAVRWNSASTNDQQPNPPKSPYYWLYVTFMVVFYFSLLLVLAAPYLLRLLYLGKFWGQQGWFFGFEGYLPIETIERQIFGARLGRLRWSPYSSTLSRHQSNEHGECEGTDPTSDPATRELVKRAKNAQPGEQRVFTVVDTGTYSFTRESSAWSASADLKMYRQYDRHDVSSRSSACVFPAGGSRGRDAARHCLLV